MLGYARAIPQYDYSHSVDEARELVGLQDYAERRPNQLSGGQQQRVALARTIVVEPKILLLDEPLSNLDARLRVHMRQELLSLQRKLSLTTIFVTHDQEEANTTSDRIAVLKDGVVQQVGNPIELYDQPANLFVAQFLGTANIIQGEVKAEGSEIVFDDGNGFKLSLKDRGTNGAQSIAFRPQNITPEPENGPDSDFLGEVTNCEFLGHIIRYAIRIGEQNILVDELYNQGKAPVSPGHSVGLKINKEQIIFI